MPFGGAGHLDCQVFHAPGAKPWHYAELRTLSVIYPQLFLTPWILCLRCAHLNLHTFSCFFHKSCTILQGPPAYSPNDFHQLSWPGLKPATPRWESLHSNHQPIRFACYCSLAVIYTSIQRSKRNKNKFILYKVSKKNQSKISRVNFVKVLAGEMLDLLSCIEFSFWTVFKFVHILKLFQESFDSITHGVRVRCNLT